ncbi:UNVERIFIED_CONTAM: hypothetical protein Sradi_6535800 [Sesamum radiatum]|uniref:DUF4218 domain-containing protein n=1 Tax=Sesamum radiatum TaxID=300843 RepID=A0AAW2JVT2_SESRA
MLPEHVWSALIEVSLLFQSICPTTLDVRKLNELENNVDIILCNLEKIFLPAIFDLMEHLIVHLPYEARVRGPVQYRWMYPFERFLRELKKKVKNKAFVEASIVEAYIVEEIGMCTSQYFESFMQSKRSMPRRNDECTSNNDGFQVSYRWDCDHESMFKLVKSQAGKFLRKRFANARNQWARPLRLAEEIWRQLL